MVVAFARTRREGWLKVNFDTQMQCIAQQTKQGNFLLVFYTIVRYMIYTSLLPTMAMFRQTHSPSLLCPRV